MGAKIVHFYELNQENTHFYTFSKTFRPGKVENVFIRCTKAIIGLIISDNLVEPNEPTLNTSRGFRHTATCPEANGYVAEGTQIRA